MKASTILNFKPSPEILLLALFNLVIHLVFCTNLEYHRDELLYFSLGMHPDAGYATVPPLIGWIAMLMQKLFGYSVFAVRLFPAILSSIMIILAGELTKELGGSRYAVFLSAVGLTISVFFQRTNLLFQPVHTEVFLWTLAIYLLVKYINSSKDRYLILFGIISGLTMLNKYLGIILYITLLVVVPFTEHRLVFRKRAFWIGIAAGILVFSPNLIWQISRDFPVFRHMGELYDTQLVHMDVKTFLIEQLMMPFAGSVFTVAGLIYLLSRKKAGKFWFLGLTSAGVILALLLLKGKSYYSLGVFPLLICAGAVAYEKWITSGLIRVLLPIVLIILTIPVLPMGLPVYDKEGLKIYFSVLDEKYGIDQGRRFEDGSIHSLPQDYADMLGWEELTAITDKAYRAVEDKKACFIYCENYGQAGAITVIGKKYGLPEAVCFSESFGYWYPEIFVPDITSLIYINDELGEDVAWLFQNITEVGYITDPDAREYKTTVWLCRDPRDSFNKFWTERLREFREPN